MLPRSLAGKPAPDFTRGPLAELINSTTGCFKRELTVSLRTSDLRTAKRLDMREGTRVGELFELAEKLIATGPTQSRLATGETIDFQELQAATLAELLAKDDAEREGDDRRHLQTAEERAQWPDLADVPTASAKHMMDDHYLVYGEELEDLEQEYRSALARRNPKIVDAELRAALKQRGIAIDPAAPWYYEAGLVILRAHAEAYGLMRGRHSGDDVPTPKALSSSKGPKLSEGYEVWKAGSPARGTRKPSDRTLLEADNAIRRFKEMHGDIRLGDITRERAREFRDALARMPTRLPEKLRKLPIREILRAPEVSKFPPPHGNTVNKVLNLLSAIISNAQREGLTDQVQGFVNPFGKGLKLAVDDREAESREPFTKADLKAIFETPIYTRHHRPKGGGGEAAYWLPLIALLTGARQGELAQLRIGDLRQDPETGIWFFDIGTEGGRSIKTASSRRKVPVHSELERIGLIQYRQSLLDSGASVQASLWPDIKSDSKGRQAGPWSKWFNRYLRDTAGIEEGGKVFHSFRHTFKRMARDAGLSEEMHDALTGHTGGGVGRSYGGGFGLRLK